VRSVLPHHTRRVRRTPHGGKTGALALRLLSRVGKPPGATWCGRSMTRALLAFRQFSPEDLERLPHCRAGPITLVSETIVVCLQKASQNARGEFQNPSRLLIPEMYSYDGIWDNARVTAGQLNTGNKDRDPKSVFCRVHPCKPAILSVSSPRPWRIHTGCASEGVPT
jgi:hypothetical protein